MYSHSCVMAKRPDSPPLQIADVFHFIRDQRHAIPVMPPQQNLWVSSAVKPAPGRQKRRFWPLSGLSDGPSFWQSLWLRSAARPQRGERSPRKGFGETCGAGCPRFNPQILPKNHKKRASALAGYPCYPSTCLASGRAIRAAPVRKLTSWPVHSLTGAARKGRGDSTTGS